MYVWKGVGPRRQQVSHVPMPAMQQWVQEHSSSPVSCALSKAESAYSIAQQNVSPRDLRAGAPLTGAFSSQ